MTDIKFRSDLPVTIEPEGCCGSDRLFSRVAWVTKPGTQRPDESDLAYERVVRAMLKGRHGTPFEKGLMTVYVECPAVVWWEWTRHRFMGLDIEDFSFNLESGRYKILDGQFYIPSKQRPLLEPDGFKPMRPVLENGSDADYLAMVDRHNISCQVSWNTFKADIEAGVAREVARLRLGFDIYYAGYVEAKPRTWLQFFSLRTNDERAAIKTYPQWEIEQVSKQCEVLFAERWPITYRLFNETGRLSP